MGQPIHADVTSLKTTSRSGGADDNFLESADARNVAISNANEARIRYNDALECYQASVNGGPYECILTGDAPQAGMYMSAPAPTPLPAANTPAQILGTTTSKYLNEFTHAANQLTYIGQNPRNFTVIVSLSAISNTAAHTVRYYIAKNGVVIADSQQQEYVEVAADIENAALKTIVNLSNGDTIEIWAETSAANPALTITVENMWVVVFATPGAGLTAKPLDFPLGDDQTAGCSSNNAAFQTWRRFRYRGTNLEGVHANAVFLAARTGGAGSGEVQIIDEISGLTIAAQIGIVAGAPTIFTVPLANLSATPSIWRLEGRRVGGGTTITLYSLHIE